ncbi:MAG TPA: Rrf2 family transcriptional regulator [Pirellulaceae bacterium]|nr:Rrf2 family transcriptional regulator [Pirellulaceae bacterium]
MIISNKCLYGLKAMLELALRDGQGPVTVGQIAHAQGIPARFLEAILRQLKQAGLTDSTRGKEGGYTLARTPQSIPVGEIIRLIEGPLLAVNSATTNENSPSALPVPDIFSELWREAEAALDTVLMATTLADLVDREQRRVHSEAANYTI